LNVTANRAIRRVGEAFERDVDRKALVTMATGAGKTRTVIALCDLLMRCNWAKRVLFLRPGRLGEPGRQCIQETFARRFAGKPRNREGQRRPGLCFHLSDNDGAHRRIARWPETVWGRPLNLVIIDEAHRSVYQKYGAIFDYFDSLLVGLTATPKDEVDRNTYRLFELEDGVPTDNYSLDEAVRDGF
jgi:type I restriction enzyme, R subunit